MKFFIFLIVAVGLGTVSADCNQGNLHTVFLVDTTIKEADKPKLLSGLNSALGKFGRVGKTSVFAFNNRVHPVTTIASNPETEKFFAEKLNLLVKTGFVQKKDIKNINGKKKFSPIEIIESVIRDGSETATAINIGEALQHVSESFSGSEQMTKAVVLIASKPSYDDPSTSLAILRSKKVALITVAVEDTAHLDNIASSSNFALNTKTVTELPHALCEAGKALTTSHMVSFKEVPFVKKVGSSFASACPMGFSGPNCGNVVCPIKGVLPAPTSNAQNVDMVLAPRCSGSANLPIDSHVTYLKLVLVSGNNSIPVITLTKPNGQIASINETVNVVNTTDQVYVEVPNPMLGMWQVKYQTANDRFPCLYAANVNTNFGPQVAFVPARNFIAPLIDRGSKMIIEGTGNFFIVHASGLPCPGKIQTLQIYENFALIFQSHAQTRYHCSYEYYFGWIYCNTLSIYYYKMFGVDENGYAFERTDAITCIRPIPTPPPTQPPKGCQNGGVLYNGHCLCAPNWQGMHCTVPICNNGGSANGNTCQCQTGWSGPFCQLDMCLMKNNSVTNNPNGRSLSFVIQTTTTMTFDINQIQTNIEYLITQINQQTLNTPNKWFSKYNIVLFDNKGAKVFMSTSSQQLFQTGIKFVQAEFTVGQVNVMTFTAIKLALTEALPYSPVYVFTDSNPGDYAQDTTTIPYVEASKNNINFIFSSLNPGGQPFGTSPGTQIIQYITGFSDGQIFTVEKQIVAELIRIIPTHYSSGLVLEDTFADCSNGQTVYFPIDKQATAFTFYAAGLHAQTSLLDGNGNLFYARPLVNSSAQVQVLQAAAAHGVHGNDRVVSGLWTAKITTQKGAGGAKSPCRFQIRVQSPLQFYYGFVQNKHSDNPAIEPVMNGGSNYMIAHASGMNMTQGGIGKLEYMNIILWDYYHNQTVYGSAGFSPRGNCGYEYVSQTFMCPNFNFGIALAGYDNAGYPFNRLRVAMCLPQSMMNMDMETLVAESRKSITKSKQQL